VIALSLEHLLHVVLLRLGIGFVILAVVLVLLFVRERSMRRAAAWVVSVALLAELESWFACMRV
jgi:hypothetical protein